eukprot:gnl/Ergobibamus_cyprinoides/3687.p1 GENE.gnl/Ergobibamus_cyprinoides/3687~~gnl/Ergobibamus_cyprinoides/3687.p1  ORF type:complete len:155 (-),score=10.08 gnl/Ergobibamus_cyprinoides/3687:39-503(-)
MLPGAADADEGAGHTVSIAPPRTTPGKFGAAFEEMSSALANRMSSSLVTHVSVVFSPASLKNSDRVEAHLDPEGAAASPAASSAPSSAWNHAGTPDDVGAPRSKLSALPQSGSSAAVASGIDILIGRAAHIKLLSDEATLHRIVGTEILPALFE